MSVLVRVQSAIRQLPPAREAVLFLFAVPFLLVGAVAGFLVGLFHFAAGAIRAGWQAGLEVFKDEE